MFVAKILELSILAQLAQKTVKHQRKSISTPKARGKRKTSQSYAARLIRSFSQVQHLFAVPWPIDPKTFEAGFPRIPKHYNTDVHAAIQYPGLHSKTFEIPRIPKRTTGS